MTKKLSYMPWVPADWLNDTRGLSVEAKGCWIDILCLMWNAPKRGVWTGTYQDFARATGCPWNQAEVIVTELTKVANLTLSNDNLTLKNRRMTNRERVYRTNAIRQKRFYDKRHPNANLTNQTLDVDVKTLDVKAFDVKDVHQSQRQDNTLAQAPKRATFSKPSVEEVRDYCEANGYGVEASKFWDHYEANGWRVGRNPMKNWQAAVRQWTRSEFQTEGKNGTHERKSIFGLSDSEGPTGGHPRSYPGLRKITSPREILAGVGDMHVPDEDRKEEPEAQD